MSESQKTKPQRGQRVVYHGADHLGEREHPAIILRVSQYGGCDLVVFMRGRQPLRHRSVQHISVAPPNCSGWDYPPAKWDWDTRAAA